MGQAKDEAGATPEFDDTPAEDAGSLRYTAVAIDPPPRGALGIRDLLELLEKEAGRGFPAVAGTPPETKTPIRRPVSKQG